MRVQYFSDEYISETETVDLIEKVSEKYKDIEGKILYKFPSIVKSQLSGLKSAPTNLTLGSWRLKPHSQL